MKNNKILKIFTASAVLASVVAPVTSAASFTDVKETNSHYDAIQSLVKRDIINGYEDKTYRPNATLTRGQTAKILANLLNLDTSSKLSKFTDIPTSSEYIGAINALAERGIINGYEDGTFKPSAPITRGQMAKIIVNTFELDIATDINLPFTDVTEKNGYRSYIQTLLNHKITQGSSLSIYAPNQAVKRGQMASFVVRAEQVSTQLKENKPVEGTISSIGDTQIVIGEQAFTIPDELKTILSPSNELALMGAKVKATVSADTLISVQALTITAESSADNPIVLNGSLAKLPTANLTPPPKSNVAKFDGVLTVESEYVRLENVEFTNEIVIKKGVKHITLNNQIEKLTIFEDVEATIAGTAIINRLVVTSNKALNLELTGSIKNFEVKTAKANIRLNKGLSIIKYILQDGVKVEDIISNYTSNTSHLDGSISFDSGDVLLPDGSNDHQLPGTVTAVKGYISEVTGNTVKIDGKNYTLADSVKALFTSNNKSSLIGSHLTANIENGKVTLITHLALNNAGTFDGSGLTIKGDLLVNADNQSVRNLVVAGNVTISSSIKESVDFKAVDVRGKVSIVESAEIARLQRTASLAMPVAETVITRVKIIFADSTVAFMEIKRTDIELGLYGTTHVTTISTEANTSIIANSQVILPKLTISKGVTHVELNASIALIEVDSNNDIYISGKGNFNLVVIKTDKTVTLNTTGTIHQLASDRTNITLGQAVRVNKTTSTTGEVRNAKELIRNYVEVKDNINVDIKDGELEQHFAAKVVPVEGKYGFVTLSVFNAGDAKIKYRLVSRVEGEDTPSKVGQIAPSNLITYKLGDEFIAWYNSNIEVYKVNNNIITDVYVVSQDNQWFRHDFINAYILNNKVTIETLINPDYLKGNNNKNTLNELLLINGKQQYYFDGFIAKNWTLNSIGIPAITVNLPDDFTFDLEGYSILYFETEYSSGGVLLSLTHTNEKYIEAHIEGIRSLIQIVNPSKIQKLLLDNYLSEFSNENIPLLDENNNIIEYKHIYHYNHLSNLHDEYKTELKKSNFTKPEEVLAIIKAINEQNNDLIVSSNQLVKEINALFVNDFHKYPFIEQLVPTVNIMEINKLRADLSLIPYTIDYKKYLEGLLDLASQIYNFRNLNREALILAIENAKDKDISKLSSMLQKTVSNRITMAEGILNSSNITQRQIDETTIELNEFMANLLVEMSSVTLQDKELKIIAKELKNTIQLSGIYYDGEVQEGSVITINGVNYSYQEPFNLLNQLHQLGYECYQEKDEMGDSLRSFIVSKKNSDVTTEDIASVTHGLIDYTSINSESGYKQVRINLNAFIPSWVPTEIQIGRGAARTFHNSNHLLEELKKSFPAAEVSQHLYGRLFEISGLDINEDDITVLTNFSSKNFLVTPQQIELKLTFSEAVQVTNGKVYINSQSLSYGYDTSFNHTGINELVVSIRIWDDAAFDISEFLITISGVSDINNKEVVVENVEIKM
ncbi:S-layer homology domain-containing protein [Solibacillus sp. FSL W8-0474]|uniref:S-layer homology domain-containing protein n=1 Tax=Solibacillus sp. FSL W8-0474 TaxID=2975336 RepID=UPI0030F5058A